MRLLFLLVLSTVAAGAQQIGQNKASGAEGQTYTLSVKTQLVVETVVVKDKAGKPIEGLTAKDFTLTEDGAPQAIRFLEHQDLTTAQVMPLADPGTEDIKIYKRLGRTQLAPEAAGATRYKDRRLVSLYFDMTAMRPAEQLRALSGCGEVRAHADDDRGSGLDSAVRGRIGGCAAGFHGGSESSAEYPFDDGGGRGARVDRVGRRCE